MKKYLIFFITICFLYSADIVFATNKFSSVDFYHFRAQNYNYANHLTRQEAVQLIAQLYEKEFEMYQNQKVFDDTISKAASFLKEKNVLRGNLFYPNRLITREEFVHILASLIEQTSSLSIQTTFLDDQKISTWAKKSIIFFQQQKIDGLSGSSFRPKEKIKTEEALLILNSFYEKLFPKTIFLNGCYLRMGESLSQLQKRYITEKDYYCNGLVWHQIKDHPIQIAIFNQKVVAVFAVHKNISFGRLEQHNKYFTNQTYHDENYHYFLGKDLKNNMESIFAIHKNNSYPTLHSDKINNHNMENIVWDSINMYRSNQSLPRYQKSKTAESLAKNHLYNMIRYDFFDFSNHQQQNIRQRYEEENLFYQYLSENIGKGTLHPQQIVMEWMQKPAMRTNILSKDFQSAGVAVDVKQNHLIIVVDFNKE